MIESIASFVGISVPLVFYFIHPVSNIESEYCDRQSKAMRSHAIIGI